MARKRFEFVNNTEKVIQKIKEKPTKVLNIIGSNLISEIKSNIKSSNSRRRGMLINSLGYWARKQERDLQIGFKMSIVANEQGVGPGIVGDMITRKEPDPILPVVKKNVDLIVQMIGKALDEIRRE